MKKHAIIVIKNEKNEYLQYYDEIWKSYLFLNSNINDIKQDSDIIKEKLISELKLNPEEIKNVFVGKKKHKKFSERDKIEKEYEHYFFDVSLNKLPNIMKNNCFEINGVKYKWFSYNNLKSDKRIQEVNSDIVNYIKEFNM